MKLSFSTNRWNSVALDEFIDIACEYKFKGIEIHNVDEVKNVSDLYHKLLEHSLKISCIDMVSDISGNDINSAIEEFNKCVEICSMLHTPYIRLKAYTDNEQNVRSFIEQTVQAAQSKGIVMLVETVGIYADTKRLAELLNSYACDNVAALWDLHYPYREAGELPENTVTNLGAYIRHIHINSYYLRLHIS